MPTKKTKKHIEPKSSPKPERRRKPFIPGDPTPYTPNLYRRTPKKQGE